MNAPQVIEVLRKDDNAYLLYFDGDQVGRVTWEVPIFASMDTYYWNVEHKFGRPFQFEHDPREKGSFESEFLQELKKRLGFQVEYRSERVRKDYRDNYRFELVCG